jgi:hypothetical protein
MTLPDASLVAFRELQRRIEGVSGQVTMWWRPEPRFGYGGRPVELRRSGSVIVATSGADALALLLFAGGEAEIDDSGVQGQLVHSRMGTPLTAANEKALLEPPASSCATTGCARRSSTYSPTSPTAHIAYGALVGGFIHLAG